MKYHVSLPRERAEIRLEVVPYRDFLDDIALLDHIERNDFLDGDHSFDYEDYKKEHFPRDSDDDAIDELDKLESEKDWWIRHQALSRLQERILDHGATVSALRCVPHRFRPNTDGATNFRNTSAPWQSWLL